MWIYDNDNDDRGDNKTWAHKFEVHISLPQSYFLPTAVPYHSYHFKP